MRLDGGGRNVTYPERDMQLAEWIKDKGENKQPVSRRIIANKAANVFLSTQLKVFFYLLDGMTRNFRSLLAGLQSFSSAITSFSAG